MAASGLELGVGQILGPGLHPVETEQSAPCALLDLQTTVTALRSHVSPTLLLITHHHMGALYSIRCTYLAPCIEYALIKSAV
jgi:hypothetical protein